MRTLAKETWQIAGYNWKNILLFEFLYRGVTMPVYLRFVNRSLHLALKMAGYSYLTAGNIGSFLVRPGTICMAGAVCLVGAVLLIVETASLITAFQGSAYYQKLTPLQMLWGGMQKTADEIWRKNWQLGLVILAQYLFANLLFLIRAASHVKPVNFIMQEMAKEPWLMALTAVLLLLCFLAAFPALLSVPCCMIEQKNFTDARYRSIGLMRKRRVKIIFLLAGFHVLSAAVVFLLYFFSVVAAAVFIEVFTKKNLAMAVLLSVSDKLELGLLFLGSILSVAVQYAAVSVMFYQYGNRQYHGERWNFGYPSHGTAGRRRMAAVFCAIVGISLIYIYDLVRNGSALSDEILIETQITAHRGSSLAAPENTLSAVQAAIDDLADSVEIDVQLSRDGVVVLGHDASLKRVAGVNRSISALNWEELQKLDVGSWFSSDFAGERIPALEEVLELCKGKINLNIELKNIGPESLLPEKTVGLVMAHGMEEQCVITSASLNYLKDVKALEPQLRTGYIISAAYGNFYSSEAVDFISLRSGFVNEKLVENIHVQGKAIYAWTVNSKSEMERLVMLGVDGIITDRPVLAREIIYREEATENLMEYVRLVFK